MSQQVYHTSFLSFDRYEQNTTVTCAYPLSDQYGLLNRYLYYTLLIFAICAWNSKWSSVCALASAVVYCGAAVIHAFVLAIISKGSLVDLDMKGAFVICVASFSAFPFLYLLSSSVRPFLFRLFIKVYGLVAFVGAVCATIAMSRNYSVESPCYSDSKGILVSASQLDSSFNCSYTCFKTTQGLRNPTDIVAIPIRNFANIFVLASLGFLIAPFFILFTFFLYKHAHLFQSNHLTIDQGNERVDDANLKSNTTQSFSSDADLNPGNLLYYIICAIAPVLPCELSLLAQDRGANFRRLHAIGQWGPLAGVSLITIAAVVASWFSFRPRLLRQQRRLSEAPVDLPTIKTDNRHRGTGSIASDALLVNQGADLEDGFRKSKDIAFDVGREAPDDRRHPSAVMNPDHVNRNNWNFSDALSSNRTQGDADQEVALIESRLQRTSRRASA